MGSNVLLQQVSAILGDALEGLPDASRGELAGFKFSSNGRTLTFAQPEVGLGDVMLDRTVGDRGVRVSSLGTFVAGCYVIVSQDQISLETIQEQPTIKCEYCRGPGGPENELRLKSLTIIIPTLLDRYMVSYEPAPDGVLVRQGPGLALLVDGAPLSADGRIDPDRAIAGGLYTVVEDEEHSLFPLRLPPGSTILAHEVPWVLDYEATLQEVIEQAGIKKFASALQLGTGKNGV